MFNIAQPSPEDYLFSPRRLGGATAVVGWEVTRDRVVHWCGTCAGFHITTGHRTGDVRSYCPRMGEGERLVILNFGPVSISVIWSMYRGFLNAETRRELRQALSALDALIESQEVAG